jgi:tRNA(fMet)-specific endonuclease VapC
VISFLIDTDLCSAHLRNIGNVSSKFLQYTGQLHISVLTLGELLSWTRRSKSAPKYHQALLRMLSDVTVLDVDQAVATKFGEVRAQLLDQGQPVASIDLMIGATALIHGLTMVTHNVLHFSKIPGLTVDDWLAP